MMTVEVRNKVIRQIFDNPVVLKELRGRMRGARAFVVLTVYLVLLGAFSSLVYVAVSQQVTPQESQLQVWSYVEYQIRDALVGSVYPTKPKQTPEQRRDHAIHDR